MNTDEQDTSIQNRLWFLLIGEKLSVKLSYLNSSLQGTETFHGVPNEDYWREHYPDDPHVIPIKGDIAVRSPHGWFLLWQNGVHATEMVGEDAKFMPTVRLSYEDLWRHEDMVPHHEKKGFPV
jgi:hypothetical protein